MFVTGAFILHLLIADVAHRDREMQFMAFSFDKGHSYNCIYILKKVSGAFD